MGKEPSLKLSQRGLDARAEVPMRTPKRLYAEERIIYHPELLTCLHCGDLLVAWNYRHSENVSCAIMLPSPQAIHSSAP
jgi:hypothetical protein